MLGRQQQRRPRTSSVPPIYAPFTTARHGARDDSATYISVSPVSPRKGDLIMHPVSQSRPAQCTARGGGGQMTFCLRGFHLRPRWPQPERQEEDRTCPPPCTPLSLSKLETPNCLSNSGVPMGSNSCCSLNTWVHTFFYM